MKRSAPALLSICLLSAQAPLQFEVASVKVDKDATGVRGGCHGIDSQYTAGESGTAPPLGRCVIRGGRLSHLIGIAWQIDVNQIANAPDWAIRGFDRFDVQAEAVDPARTTEAQLRSMLQAMLEDRFQLKFHRRTVDRAGFAVAMAAKGARLTATTAPDMSERFGFGGDIKPSSQSITLTARRYSLALVLSRVSGQPVVDQTGLAGNYDFTLHWDDDQGPALETAVREQLGLRLVPKKVPLELFVIDSAQKPSAN